MQHKSPVLESDRLRHISRTLAEHRRTGRADLLKESARGQVDAGQVLHALNGLRWLDAVGYHAWRAAHHLDADRRDAEDNVAGPRPEAEFSKD